MCVLHQPFELLQERKGAGLELCHNQAPKSRKDWETIGLLVMICALLCFDCGSKTQGCSYFFWWILEMDRKQNDDLMKTCFQENLEQTNTFSQICQTDLIIFYRFHMNKDLNVLNLNDIKLFLTFRCFSPVFVFLFRCYY